jgi:hypothetical protein
VEARRKREQLKKSPQESKSATDFHGSARIARTIKMKDRQKWRFFVAFDP